MLTFLRKFVSFLLTTVLMYTAGFTNITDPRITSMQSITKVADGLYTMDYTYDYGIDNLLTAGIKNTVQLIIEGVRDTILSDGNNFGCTTFNAVTEEGDYLLARNFDYMDGDCMLVWTHPDNGYESVSSVSLSFLGYDEDFTPEAVNNRVFTLLAPYTPLDGINEKGLAIGVLELETDPVIQVGNDVSLTTTTMIRAVLDKAADVEEAIAIFKKYNMRDAITGECTYHYHITDAEGNSVVIEYVDGEVVVIEPEERTESSVLYQCAANYYLAEGVDDPDGMGQERAETVFSVLDAAKGALSVKNAMNLLQKVSMKDADLHGYICSTLWSSVYNNTDLSVDVAVRTDYENVYHFTLDTPQEYTLC